MKSWCGVSLLTMTLAGPVTVTGTWSIIAIDKQTNQIGSAVATCVDSDFYPEDAREFLEHGFSAVPYRGGIVAQANIQDDSGPSATVGLPLLREGHSAQTVVSGMANKEADPEIITYESNNGQKLEYPIYELRQYGVVTYNETSPMLGYTGSQLTPLYRAFGFEETEETSSWSVTENYTVSVQGNLVFPGTVKATLVAFEESQNTDDFAERLFGALKEGYIATGGDVRCAYNPELKGAVLSFLKVMEEDGTYSVDLEESFGKSQEKSALDSIEADLMARRKDKASSTTPPSSEPTSVGTITSWSGNSIVAILLSLLTCCYYL